MEKNVSIDLGDPIDVIAMNRDRTYVATTSRTGLKILSVDGNKFEVKFDQRKLRKNLMQNIYSGLAWSQTKGNVQLLNDDNLVASSQSGTVMLWDINNCQPSSVFGVTFPDHQYRTPKQTVTSIAFSEFNEHLMVSGTKEGGIQLYDIRQRDKSLSFPQAGKEAIRDLRFFIDAKSQDLFVSADDSGTVRFWDVRRPERMLNEFLAHSSGVISAALHPQLSSKHLMASGGRDRFVRVWDCARSPAVAPDQTHSVEMASTALTRVSWCHDNAWHLATCGANDNAVHVWDVRRPYLPFATFTGHSDVVADMCWPRYGCSDRFVSAGKNGRLILHFLDQCVRPLSLANTVAITCASGFDGVVVAMPERKRSSSCASAADALDPFRRNVPSTLFCVRPADAESSISRSATIAYLAKHYKLFGGTLERLCEHNAEVAERLAGSPDGSDDDGYGGSSDGAEAFIQLAYAWRMVALLCAGTELTNSAAGHGQGDPSGARPATQLLTRSEFYRRTILGRDTSLDVADGAGSEIVPEPSGLIVAPPRQHTAGAEETGAGGKFDDGGGGGTSGGGELSDSGSETDESNSASTSSSMNDNLIVLQSDALVGGDSAGGRRRRRRRRRRALVAGTTLISGSLSQIAQNSLNADFFFGVNELNLYGMSAYGNTSDGTDKSDVRRSSDKRPEAIGGREEAVGWRRHELSRRRQTSGSKQSLLSYSSDLALIKDEAFDFRAHRHHSGTTADDFTAADFSSHRCAPAGGPAGGLFTASTVAQRQNSSHGGPTAATVGAVESDADGPSSMVGRHASEEETEGEESASGTASHELVEEVVDLIDDCVGDDPLVDGTGLSSTSCPSSGPNSVSADEMELNASMYVEGSGAAVWDPLPRIKAMLDYYSDIGDVQTCAAICIVLGERFFELKLIKPAQIDVWLFGYLELLERLEMWNAAAALIKTSYRLKMNQLSNESTFVKPVCMSCGSMAVRSGWLCRVCSKPMSGRCAICEFQVRGVWCACVDCGHGGHAAHVRDWFDQSNVCPFAGCGHKCLRPTVSNALLGVGQRQAGQPAASAALRRSPYSSTPPPPPTPALGPQSSATLFARTKR